jgi:hypothetical protein
MQRGVLIFSIALIVGAIAYLASQPGTTTPVQTAPVAQAPVAAPQVASAPFGPTVAESEQGSSNSGPGDWLMRRRAGHRR